MAYLENREYTGGLPLTAVKFHSIEFLAHWHTEIELVLIYEGQLGIGINSGYQVLEAGDMAMFARGDIHFYDSKGLSSTVLIIVFKPEMIAGIIDPAAAERVNIILTRPAARQLGLDDAELSRMRDCFDVIFDENSSRTNRSEAIISSRVAELTGRFIRLIPQNAKIDPGALGQGSKRLLQKAIRYINENFRQELTLENLSQHLNISPFYFSRLFSMTTGMTFKRYLNTLRIEKAHQLIASTDRPITDIAFECGFGSIRTFNRVFLEIRGAKPSSLRQVTDIQSGS